MCGCPQSQALEAQEAVDAAAKMAAKRERSEGDLLQAMEVAEQNNWRSLVTVRHSVVKYRTMSKAGPAGCCPPGHRHAFRNLVS